jgi:mRNA-degrading endonuclease RelE of RelBE toxin-antitoxin system
MGRRLRIPIEWIRRLSVISLGCIRLDGAEYRIIYAIHDDTVVVEAAYVRRRADAYRSQ